MPGGIGVGLGVKGLADFGNPAALGHRVRRFGRAIDDDLGNEAFDLFEINAGDVMLTSLYGIVVTIAIAAAAKPTLQFTPDSNAAGITPMCVVESLGGDWDGDPVDTIYCWDGTVGGALDPATGTGIGIASFSANFQILSPGIISYLNDTGDVCTAGVVDWVLHYVPLDTDSVVIPIYD